jgi:hypothetical protein
MIGRIAHDFILGIIFGRMMSVALVVEIPGMKCNNRPANAAGLGIPSDMIADLESDAHFFLARRLLLTNMARWNWFQRI